jgi:hypothetical protein
MASKTKKPARRTRLRDAAEGEFRSPKEPYNKRETVEERILEVIGRGWSIRKADGTFLSESTKATANHPSFPAVFNTRVKAADITDRGEVIERVELVVKPRR